MNKKDYTGWQDVFRFAFVQGAKSTSYTGSLIIMSLIIFALIVGMNWYNNRDEKQLGSTQVQKLSVYNESGIPFEFGEFARGERYGGMTIVSDPEIDYDQAVEAMEKSKETCAELLVNIRMEEARGFVLTFVKASDSEFSDEDLDALTVDFANFFDEIRVEAIQVTPEQKAILDLPVTYGTERVALDEEGQIVVDEEELSDSLSLTEYSFFLGCIMVVMMTINLAGAQIANGIVTEKSTRVIEYLMINVRPLALIVGKILAAILLVLIQLGGMGIAYVAGSLVSQTFFGTKEEVSGNMGEEILDLLSGITAGELLIVLVCIVLGILFFGILAGLAGASVSKLEELAEGMKTYQMILVISTYAGMGILIAEMTGKLQESILNLLCMIPVTAPFVLPGNIILGKVPMWAALVGVGLLLVLTVLLFRFTANVYESMIFYNGNVLKLKDIIAIAKNRTVERKEKNHHE